MRIALLTLLLTLPFVSCSLSSFHSVNSTATITMASGWQASVISHYDTIEVEHKEGSKEATFLTAGHEILVAADRILIDGEEMVRVPEGATMAGYETDDFNVRVTTAK